MDYFYEYVRTFNLDDKNISLKYHHSIRVMKKMLSLSHELSLNEEDTYLAKMIGLLHDIGRFYQINAYHTFSDHILDHGDYGANLLIKEKLIKKFKIKEEDYPVVYTSIKYHNKYKIPNTLSPREELFLKMIRDADKIDIFYILSNNKNLIIIILYKWGKNMNVDKKRAAALFIILIMVLSGVASFMLLVL